MTLLQSTQVSNRRLSVLLASPDHLDELFSSGELVVRQQAIPLIRRVPQATREGAHHAHGDHLAKGVVLLLVVHGRGRQVGPDPAVRLEHASVEILLLEPVDGEFLAANLLCETEQVAVGDARARDAADGGPGAVGEVDGAHDDVDNVGDGGEGDEGVVERVLDEDGFAGGEIEVRGDGGDVGGGLVVGVAEVVHKEAGLEAGVFEDGAVLVEGGEVVRYLELAGEPRGGVEVVFEGETTVGVGFG